MFTQTCVAGHVVHVSLGGHGWVRGALLKKEEEEKKRRKKERREEEEKKEEISPCFKM